MKNVIMMFSCMLIMSACTLVPDTESLVVIDKSALKTFDSYQDNLCNKKPPKGEKVIQWVRDENGNCNKLIISKV